jgi:hypothetical protein
MDRRTFIKSASVAACLTSVQKHNSAFAQSSDGDTRTLVSIDISLSGAGRVGFYIDYSERANPGEHTFYVSRTHGTTGVVSVDFETLGDSHSSVTGTLEWSDGAADVKRFTVVVPSKTNGDHRIRAVLKNPTNGLELHHGSDTIAHGVIDDDTIAAANTIFIDANSLTDGNGSVSSPFNNWYSARDSVINSTRYIYIKGMLVPDNTDTNTGGLTVKHLKLPTSWSGKRTNEDERLYIRSWPGFSGGIDGGGQFDCTGFYAEQAINFITFRKLQVTNLNNRDGGSLTGKSYFIRSRGSCSYWTVEEVTIDGILSGANAATAVWFSESGTLIGGGGYGHKMWKVSADNCTHAFATHKLNLFESYRATQTSIQRCLIGKNCGGIYQKSTLHEGNAVGLSVRFCFFNNGQVRLSHQGSTSNLADYHIVQGNIFDSVGKPYTTAPVRIDSAGSPPDTSTKQWIVGNIFYNYANTTHSPIRVEELEYQSAIIFNNIFVNTKGVYRFDYGPGPEYSDYNHFYNVSGELFVLNNSGGVYGSLEEIKVTGLEESSTENEPQFINATNGDFQLQPNSPAKSTGISGTDKGPYLSGIEAVGRGVRPNPISDLMISTTRQRMIKYLTRYS